MFEVIFSVIAREQSLPGSITYVTCKSDCMLTNGDCGKLNIEKS